MPAFEPAKATKQTHDAVRPASYKSNGRKLTALSWGGFHVKLRKPYR